MKRRARRARHEQPPAEERWRPGALHLLGLALLLSLVAAYLLRTHGGARLGLPGAYVWVTALLIAFGLQLANKARFVLPPEAEQQGAAAEVSWAEGMRMVVYHYAVMMLPEWLRASFHRRREDLPPSLPSSFAEFQAGFVDSHLALALARGSRFTRAAGPGYVRLRRGERITHVIDLRPQRRKEEIEVVTRDGITLQTSATVTFRVRQASRQPLDPQPYAYDENSIFQLTYAAGVGAAGDIPWSERIAPLASSLLIAEIARYRLDQLVLQEDDAVSMSAITGDVEQGLADELVRLFDCGHIDNCPVQILRLGVGHLEAPEEVITQRIRNWQGAWEAYRIQNETEARVSEITTIREARAAALVDLLESVTCKIAEIRSHDRETLATMFMLRVSEMLDRLIADRDEALDRPQELFDSLLKASAWLKEIAPQQTLFTAIGAPREDGSGGRDVVREAPPPRVSERLSGGRQEARSDVDETRLEEEEEAPAHEAPRPQRYRPAGATGLTAAALLAFLLYWLFVAFQLQEVDLSLPPLSWLVIAERFPLLNFVPPAFATFLATAFSPRILRHVLIPGLLGAWMASEAATGFVRSFYGFPSRAQAGAFLSRLAGYRPQPASVERRETDEGQAGEGGRLRRILQTADQRTRVLLAVELAVVTLLFMSIVVSMLFFSFLLPPTPGRRLLYNVLLVVLGGLWAAVMYFLVLRRLSNLPPAPGGLVLERDALEQMRREQTLLRVGGPGRIVAPDSDAVVTEYNGQFYRVLGPGVQSLLPFEYVRAMVDLRQQEREGEAAGVTKDGITVHSRVAVTFRIRSEDSEPEGENVSGQRQRQAGPLPTREQPYPYSERAVYLAAYAESVGGEGKVSSWTGLPVAVASGAFGRAVAQTRLDQIFDPKTPPETRPEAPHPLLLERVGEATDSALSGLGVRLVTLRMARLRAPEPVDALNISGWRAHWDKVQRLRETKVRAEAVKKVEAARTEAEVLMLQAIAEGIGKARQGGSEALVQQMVALRLLEALERVARSAQADAEGNSAVEDVSQANQEVLRRFEQMQRELAPPQSDS